MYLGEKGLMSGRYIPSPKIGRRPHRFPGLNPEPKKSRSKGWGATPPPAGKPSPRHRAHIPPSKKTAPKRIKKPRGGI